MLKCFGSLSDDIIYRWKLMYQNSEYMVDKPTQGGSMAIKKDKIEDIGTIVKIFDDIVQILGKYKDKAIHFSEETIRKISLRFNGRTIGIIGPRAAGKTTMLRILQDPSLQIDPAEEYIATGDASNIARSIVINWKLHVDNLSSKKKNSEYHIKMKMKKPKDVGGEESYRESEDGWIDVCTDANYLFYIMDADSFELNDKAKERLVNDFEWIANHAQKFAPGFEIIIFTNKMDKIRDRLHLSDWSELKTWEEENIPSIERYAKNSLGPFANHIRLIVPCCLRSAKIRQPAISSAMRYIAELDRLDVSE
jgi:hypothetical protein